jgi:cell wall-associated NlpC family hydrolase
MNQICRQGSILLLLLTLAACSSVSVYRPEARSQHEVLPASDKAVEVVLFSMSLIDTGYRFGGKNPEAGLDCSGMVSYIYSQAAGLRLGGSAADIAERGRVIERAQLRPGDLVFFNTLDRPYSHVGIYIGDQRFIHAPSSRGRVRIDRLDSSYFASRFEEARSYLE